MGSESARKEDIVLGVSQVLEFTLTSYRKLKLYDLVQMQRGDRDEEVP